VSCSSGQPLRNVPGARYRLALEALLSALKLKAWYSSQQDLTGKMQIAMAAMAEGVSIIMISGTS